jgi:hypothetical protein
MVAAHSLTVDHYGAGRHDPVELGPEPEGELVQNLPDGRGVDLHLRGTRQLSDRREEPNPDHDPARVPGRRSSARLGSPWVESPS